MLLPPPMPRLNESSILLLQIEDDYSDEQSLRSLSQCVNFTLYIFRDTFELPKSMR